MANQRYLKLAAENFQSIKKQADRAMEQLDIEELHCAPNAESNSIAVLVKHMSGNLKSRFSDFLTSDGEKPDRNRDGEFNGTYASKTLLLDAWNSGWEVLFNTLAGLKEEDLTKTVFIRSEAHSVMEAIQRQIVHQSSHSGQIVYIAKMIKDEEWTTLSIPRGKSETFNQQMNKQFK
ncbi:DUF1572 family protein [Bacillus sp. JJ1609]|uniref:DUF1572 family protein n=1 Tax=Bacillus sp. JJ1609 TaxID=3122977 RepID=UPI002FFD76C2